MPPSSYPATTPPRLLLALVAAIVGCIAFMFLLPDYYSTDPRSPSSTLSSLTTSIRHQSVVNDNDSSTAATMMRQLSLLDPKTVELRQATTSTTTTRTNIKPKTQPITTATIYITYPQRMWESRFFETDLFQRYVTGRITFRVVEHGQITPTTVNGSNGKVHGLMGSPEEGGDGGPCLAVAHPGGKLWSVDDYRVVKESYPHCKTMNTNDEKCQAPDEFDFRQYHSSKKPSHYMPLGMRYDSFTTFKKMQKSPTFTIKPPSQRTYAFNAIFSINTDKSRKSLVEIIQREQTKLEKTKDNHLAIYTSFNERWSVRANTKKTGGAMQPKPYLQILLDSIFTLSPFGHNPECFRLYEAIEAGSIPVIIRDRRMEKVGPRGQCHLCHKAMEHWYTSPVLMLESWEELYPVMERLMAEPGRLDDMYGRIREWYDVEFMGKFVREFEDVLLEGYGDGNEYDVGEGDGSVGAVALG